MHWTRPLIGQYRCLKTGNRIQYDALPNREYSIKGSKEGYYDRTVILPVGRLTGENRISVKVEFRKDQAGRFVGNRKHFRQKTKLHPWRQHLIVSRHRGSFTNLIGFQVHSGRTGYQDQQYLFRPGQIFHQE